MAGIELNVDSLKELKSKIEAIDVQLDAAQGGNAGKRSIQNSLISQYEDDAEKLSAQIVKAISNLAGEQRLGVFYGVLDKIEDALSEEMDEALEALYESQKTDTPKLSEEQVAKLAAQRKELSQGFKTLKEALTMFGVEEAASVDDPKVRRGRTSRGPTIWGKFQYFINDEALPEEANNMRFVAQRAGVKVADIKDAMKANGIDLKKPPTSFEVQLPANTLMRAEAMEEYVADFTESVEAPAEEAEETQSA